MFYYANLNEDDICTAIVETEEELENGLSIEEYDLTLLGKQYNDGNWTIPIKAATDDELAQAEMFLTLADITVKQQEQDEVLAEILLNSLGV